MTILPSIELSKEILILVKLVRNPIKIFNENLGQSSICRPEPATIKETVASLVESNIPVSSDHKHLLTINQEISQYKICLPSLKMCIANTA